MSTITETPYRNINLPLKIYSYTLTVSTNMFLLSDVKPLHQCNAVTCSTVHTCELSFSINSHF